MNRLRAANRRARGAAVGLLALALAAGTVALAGPDGTTSLAAGSQLQLNGQSAQLDIKAGSINTDVGLNVQNGGTLVNSGVKGDHVPPPPPPSQEGHGNNRGSAWGHDHGRAPVPEPATWSILATFLGLCAAGLVLEHRRKKHPSPMETA
ncbi:MAG: hypothetical protein KGS61_17090 [Verrucomicrobia bacterium]|nr:hypothetical protein [Verrucomicrobiota bacterium]